MHGTVILGETYTAGLDQTASRVFWPTSASFGNIVIEADVSNSFEEAPTPMASLYMTLDTPFHAWWKSKGSLSVPQGYGVRILKAIQGHQESPRLWKNQINNINITFGFNVQTCITNDCMRSTNKFSKLFNYLKIFTLLPHGNNMICQSHIEHRCIL